MRSLARILAGFKDLSARNELQSAQTLRHSLFADRVRIAPYFGYGTDERVRFQGRILQDECLIPSEDADTPWKNIRNLFRRFGADEMPGVRVRGEWDGVHLQTVTDADGYFRFDFSPPAVHESGWHNLSLSLPDLSSPAGQMASASGDILIPPKDAQFGVISDLDDTVLKTNVASRIRVLATVALRNARTRVPFPGVAAFYRALHLGRSGHDANPLFYVSTCPWNLFDLLTEFFRIHKIPLGPMLLKEFRLRAMLFPRAPDTHKLGSIRALLDFYPHLSFILIGDSAERDPEIYSEIVHSYPNRIPVIYIRSVATRKMRAATTDRLVTELRDRGCQLVLAPDTEFAAAHAARMGLIAQEALDDIRQMSSADSRAPSQAMFAS